MSNKIGYFGCNKFQIYLVFNIPRDKKMKKKLVKSLEADYFSITNVVCKKHFQDNQIKRSNDIFNKLENLVCSLSKNNTNSTFAFNSYNFIYSIYL